MAKRSSSTRVLLCEGSDGIVVTVTSIYEHCYPNVVLLTSHFSRGPKNSSRRKVEGDCQPLAWAYQST